MRRKESGSKKVPFGFVELPAARSQKKPRTTGLTMVADFGLPYMQVADLVTMADRYIDLAKIAVGTSRLYDLAYLRKKLALYRKHEYAKAGIPMLPVTHGNRFTQLSVLLYTVILFACSLLPFAIRMSGVLYVVSAIILGGVFLWYAWRLYTNYSDWLARRTFRYSILYLTLIFAALLLDHYAPWSY